MINILDFGAVGDGVTLDTQAVQQALDSCRESGGVVLVPGGRTYKIGTIQFTPTPNFILRAGQCSGRASASRILEVLRLWKIKQ